MPRQSSWQSRAAPTWTFGRRGSRAWWPALVVPGSRLVRWTEPRRRRRPDWSRPRGRVARGSRRSHCACRHRRQFGVANNFARRAPSSGASRSGSASSSTRPATCLASCSTSYRSPTTSLQWRRRAVALDNAAKLARQVRPFSGEVVALAGHATLPLDQVTASRRPPDGRVIPARTTDRQGVARRRPAHHRRACSAALGRAVAVLPGGARFVSGSYDCTAEVCGRSTAPSSAPSRWAFTVPRRGAARRRALRPMDVGDRRRGAAVPRRRHARPHLRGQTHEVGVVAPLTVAATESIISGSLGARSVAIDLEPALARPSLPAAASSASVGPA